MGNDALRVKWDWYKWDWYNILQAGLLEGVLIMGYFYLARLMWTKGVKRYESFGG